jgi:hypothetical protein
MKQSHLTIHFPLKSPADAKAVAQELPPLMPDFAKAQDTLGTVHYSRFVILGNNSLFFLADLDGEPQTLVGDLAKSAGPLFDGIFKHVANPPPTPVAGNSEAFGKWVKEHHPRPLVDYVAFEGASVQDIKSAAAAAGFKGGTEQHPLLISMPIKSAVRAFILEEVVLRASIGKMAKGADSVGTLHFAFFVPLADKHVGFFTIFDGTFDKYIEDFTEKIGPIFDLLFEYVTDPPPTPVSRNPHEFLKYVGANDMSPIGFYSAYPGLSVVDIRSLLADRKTAAAL